MVMPFLSEQRDVSSVHFFCVNGGNVPLFTTTSCGESTVFLAFGGLMTYN